MLSKKDKFCPHCGKAKELKQVDFLGQHFEAYVSTCDCVKNKEKEEKEANQVNKVTQEITKVMEKGNIGRRYYNADFANYQSNPQNKAMFDACKKFVKGFNKNDGMGLFLFGGVGCGKTHLAISIMKHLITKGKKVSFYKSSGLYDEYKRTFAFNNDETGEIFLQKLKKVDLLIIDDLGTDRFDDKFNLFLYKVIDTRYNDMSPIIITSNFNLNELSSVVDRRILDRLYSMCVQWGNNSSSYRSLVAQNYKI